MFFFLVCFLGSLFLGMKEKNLSSFDFFSGFRAFYSLRENGNLHNSWSKSKSSKFVLVNKNANICAMGAISLEKFAHFCSYDFKPKLFSRILSLWLWQQFCCNLEWILDAIQFGNPGIKWSVNFGCLFDARATNFFQILFYFSW